MQRYGEVPIVSNPRQNAAYLVNLSLSGTSTNRAEPQGQA